MHGIIYIHNLGIDIVPAAMHLFVHMVQQSGLLAGFLIRNLKVIRSFRCASYTMLFA